MKPGIFKCISKSKSTIDNKHEPLSSQPPMQSSGSKIKVFFIV